VLELAGKSAALSRWLADNEAKKVDGVRLGRHRALTGGADEGGKECVRKRWVLGAERVQTAGALMLVVWGGGGGGGGFQAGCSEPQAGGQELQLRCQAALPARPAASAAQAGGARRRAGEVDADAAVVPADTLSRQALEAQAGDLAIEDALYAVEKALQAGAITPDVYIKQACP